jgi:hypothetical protein
MTMEQLTPFNFLPYAACSITFFALGYSLKWFLNTISKGSEENENPTDNGLFDDVPDTTLNTPANLINQPAEESTVDLITLLQNKILSLENGISSLKADITFYKGFLNELLLTKIPQLAKDVASFVPEDYRDDLTVIFSNLITYVGQKLRSHSYSPLNPPKVPDDNMHSVIEPLSYNLEYTYLFYFVIIVIIIRNIYKHLK